MRRIIASILALACLAPASHAQLAFEITVPRDVYRVTEGRLIVSLISQDSYLFDRAEPASAPFFSDPQPMYSLEWKSETPFTTQRIETFDNAFPASLQELPPGTYKAQAVFDRVRRDSNWRRETDNPYSEPVEFTWDGEGELTVPITLTNITPLDNATMMEGVEWVGLRLEHEGDNGTYNRWMRARVIRPKNQDPVRDYPSVYIVPGFGGNQDSALAYKRALDADRMGEDWQNLHESAFIIVLDPESPNGHHLFANSDNNGPVADALIENFIPQLEERFNLIPQASARIVTGHSSGGWSALWLALEYPETFGAAFSSAPDPVDFRFVQRVNIYEDQSMYTDSKGIERPSSTRNGRVTMTIRQENAMEEVLGPDNTSAQQWDSWLAVFGPATDGHPADLYDHETGALDHETAKHFRDHDITHNLRTHPETYTPIFENSVRLIVGEEDTYDLDLAVSSLLDTLEQLGADVNNDDKPGYIKIIPNADHGTIRRTEASRAFPSQMLEHFKESGHTR